MTLLARDALRTRIFEKEEIFRPGSANEQHLRAAGYDLRIYEDQVSINGTPVPRQESVTLQPGDVATVRSYERFALPWTVAANIAVRFRFARRGLLVFTGLIVDPGFGLQTEDGQRLSFFIANIGSDAIALDLGADGHRVLTAQFFEVAPPSVTSDKPPTPTPPPLSADALSVFRDVRKLQEQLESDVTALSARGDRLETLVNAAKSAADQIVVFGVFLIAITIVGVVFVTLLTGLAANDMSKVIDNLNRLDVSGFGPIVICIALLLIALAVTLGAIYIIVMAFTTLWGDRTQA